MRALLWNVFSFPSNDRWRMWAWYCSMSPSRSLPFPTSDSKFTTIIKWVLSSRLYFALSFSSLTLLCTWHFTVCGSFWSLWGAALSSSAGPQMQTTGLQSQGFALCPVLLCQSSWTPTCWLEAENFWLIPVFRLLKVVIIPFRSFSGHLQRVSCAV